jgi:hypothetical protein
MNDATVLEEPFDEEEYDDAGAGPGRGVAIAVVLALLLGVGGYFAGHASAGGGPSTLAEAVQQARDGKLACGATAAPSATPGAQGGAPGGGDPTAFLVRAACGGDAPGGGGFQRRGTGGQGRGLFGPGATTGQVESVSGSTLTLRGQQGTVKLKLSSSTAVTTTAKGALSDLKPGQTVSVTGQGTARTIFILPAGQ